jgi:hypothetical protein
MSENQQDILTVPEVSAPVVDQVIVVPPKAQPQPTETTPATDPQTSDRVTGTKPVKDRPVMVGQTITGSAALKQNNTDDTDSLTTGPAENKCVTQTMEYTTAPVNLSDRKDLSGNSEVMFFFAERSKAVDERIRAFVSPTSLRSGKGADWNESIVAAASRSAFLDNRLESTTRREGANFQQYLETESSKLGFAAPKIAESGVAGYTGEKAVMRVRAIMGLGGLVSIPLWHSGFWITLQAPTEGSLIELYRRLQEEKIELGRETFGLVFSNEQSYINSWLLDFCMEHIYETSVRTDNNQELRPLIKIQDLNILFWGMACLIWPRGFDYVRSLTTKEGIENTQAISAKINLGKLMWVDNASFDDKSRNHMAGRQRNKMTVDQVKNYQGSFIPSLAEGRRVQIREGLELIIASTNVDNYIADGESWIAGIIQTVDSTFTQAAPNQDERNRMISTHARASRLRNYGAWIKAVVIDNFENDSRDEITQILDVLSVDEDTTKLVETEITKFIDDSTRALIAIPETSGKEMGLPRFPHLIPLDVVNTFFTLLAQRVAIISRR